MTYIYISYEACLLFASDRFLQSAENEASVLLCNILRLNTIEWSHPRIHLQACEKGLVFYTKNSNYRNGLVFDLETFHGFSETQDDRTIINIFQKTVKYSVRYFDKDPQPRANCEQELPGTSLTIIYPNPFVAKHDVPKIVVDRNSSKLNKKECNYLTVFDYNTSGRATFSSTSLNKAYEEIKQLSFVTLDDNIRREESSIRGFSVVELTSTNVKINESIGYENWLNYYLTDVQKKFVCSEVEGPERLEGAAGTGKTISLILRSMFLLNKHINDDSDFHLIFFTHSLSTKERIISIFRSNWGEYYELCEEKLGNIRPAQSIKVTTLQEWSAEHLGTNSISDNEYLDKDAAGSKLLQIYYIEEAYKKIKEELWNTTFELVCSDKFKTFLRFTQEESILELLRQEIAVLIKGRASGDFDKYKAIKRPEYSIPLINDADYRFIFMVYNKYQASLTKVGQYDSDDITLSALGHVCTPIWARRRQQDGYDVCIIDETHLFNINELSVFHYVNKPIDNGINGNTYKIIFAIDKSQASGDWGVDDVSINSALHFSQGTDNSRFNTVFRSSPDIVNLAYNILSSGVTMFTNFENPLVNSSFEFTQEDEQKAITPQYSLVESDELSVIQSVEWAEKFCADKKCSKDNVLFVGVNDQLVKKLTDYFSQHNKPFESLQSRSDDLAIKKAKAGNKFVISQIDYVGGLEFDAVIILGVDEGRVPPSGEESGDAYHVISYAWHSLLYVAVTRAKYAVNMYGLMSRGASPLLYSSILNEIIRYEGPSVIGGN